MTSRAATARKGKRQREYLIEVTDRDIRDGSPRSPQFCPISYALRRQVPKARLHPVYVGTKTAEVRGVLARLPLSAQRFVQMYDDPLVGRKALQPFKFRITI